MNDLKRILFFILGVGIVYKLSKGMGSNKLSVSSMLSDLVKKFEGLRLKAYLDAANIWTIGYGLTRYPNGTKVKEGDSITNEQAETYFKQTLQNFAQDVEDSLKSKINNNQFAALVSFAYNIGITNFKKSTLLKLVNQNPNDPKIRTEFNKWIYAKGKVLNGLVKRRELESNLYFS
jgi:lysozyme